MANLFEMFKFSKMLKVEDGNMSLMGVDINIVPTSILCSLQKGLIDAIGLEKTYNQIYESAKKGSIEYNSSFIKQQKFVDKRKILDWQAKILEFGGWGHIEIAKIDFEKNTLVAHFKQTPFTATYTKLYGKSKGPVDFITAGFNAGGLSVMAGKDLDVIETKCVSMGDAYCEFEAGPHKVIEAKRKDLWKKWKLI